MTSPNLRMICWVPSLVITTGPIPRFPAATKPVSQQATNTKTTIKIRFTAYLAKHRQAADAVKHSPPRLDDDLLHVGENGFHGFQIEPLSGHFRSRLIGGQQGVEALSLAPGFGDLRIAIGAGRIPSARSLRRGRSGSTSFS